MGRFVEQNYFPTSNAFHLGGTTAFPSRSAKQFGKFGKRNIRGKDTWIVWPKGQEFETLKLFLPAPRGSKSLTPRDDAMVGLC